MLRRGLSSRAFDRKAFETDTGLAYDLMAGQTLSGQRVSNERAMSFSAVWFCVGLISDTVAGLPQDVFRKMPDQRLPLGLPTWLKQPDSEITPVDFWQRTMVSLLLDGNSFWFVGRDVGTFQPTALHNLHPGDVQVDRARAGDPFPLGTKVFRISSGEVYDWASVLHIPAIVPPGGMRGLSPIEYARQSIGLGLASEAAGARVFGQGMHMPGVIEAPGNLTMDAARVMARTFADRHRGSENSGVPGVLTGGATWKNVTMTLEQAQFLETRRFQKSDIANFYRVPPYMVDPTVASSWGTGIQEQNQVLVTFTLAPWLTRIESAVNTFLLPRGQFFKFNVDALLRGKLAERYNSYQVAIQNGVLSPNEARALEDLPPRDNGDDFYYPSNLQVAGEPTAAELQAEQPQPDPVSLTEDQANG